MSRGEYRPGLGTFGSPELAAHGYYGTDAHLLMGAARGEYTPGLGTFGSPELARRGYYGPRTHVLMGASIFQTPGAVVDEIKSIGQQIRSFDTEIAAYLAAKGYHAPHLDLQRRQLATLRQVAAGNYDLANVDTVWKLSQMKVLREGGFTQAQADALLGNEKARNAEIARLEAFIGSQGALSVVSAPPAVQELAGFYIGSWLPFLAQWAQWENAHAVWGDNVWTNHAPEAEKLLHGLVEMRTHARAAGMKITSPEPYNPDTGLYYGSGLGGAVDAGAEKLGDVWTVLKYGAYGLLAIGGIVALTSITSHMKSGRDPAETYAALAMRRRSSP